MVVTLPTIEIRRLQERVQLRRQITDWSRSQHLLLCGHTATFGLRGVNIYNEGSIAMEAAEAFCDFYYIHFWTTRN